MELIHAYGRFTLWVGNTTDFADPLLHTHAGLLIYVVAALVLRRPLASPIPLALVYVAEAANEVLDRLNHGRWMPDTTSDVINTIFWPTMIFLVLKLGRGGRRR